MINSQERTCTISEKCAPLSVFLVCFDGHFILLHNNLTALALWLTKRLRSRSRVMHMLDALAEKETNL